MAIATETAARLAQLHQVREQSLRDLVDFALQAARDRPVEPLAGVQGSTATPKPLDPPRR